MTELFAEQWKRCKELIQDGLTPDDAKTWLPPLRLDAIGPRRAVISGVPNAFFKSRIKFQFTSLLKECLARSFSDSSLDGDFELELRIGTASDDASAPGEAPVPAGKSGRTDLSGHSSRPAVSARPGPRTAFADFIEAPSNALALRAAQDVARAPGREYNPLFICAATGMGKTHLLRAIAEAAEQNIPQSKILYCTAEAFTNDLLEGIRHRRTKTVRQRYRAVHMLLLDSVEFLLVSQRAQEELLHTFDEVQAAGGQLVFSADRMPAAMSALHPGLRSRFQMGLVAEIGAADRELRLRVLRARAEAQGLALSEEMIELLAGRITSGIRPLEGALVRLVAYASMYDESITMEFVERVAEPFFDREPEQPGLPVSSDAVFAEVCDRFEVTVKALRSRERTAHISRARRVAAYLLRELGALSYPEIGSALGGRTHSTIIHAIGKVQEELDADPHFRHAIMKVRHELCGEGIKIAS